MNSETRKVIYIYCTCATEN